MPTRTAAPPIGVRDEKRDINSLVWDLTVHELHQAFARCAFPTLAQAGGTGRSEDLTQVRMAAARHAVEDIRAALRRIESGTYGMCQQCGRIIAANRMRARPTTRWCAVCQV
jgi:RNA polymerase-binding transcription factor DksA